MTSITRSAWKASSATRLPATCRASRTSRSPTTPGRHEPGSGEINFAWLFRHLDAIGYTGWVGCEYRLATTTEAGLDWRDRLR